MAPLSYTIRPLQFRLYGAACSGRFRRNRINVFGGDDRHFGFAGTRSSNKYSTKERETRVPI